MALPNHSPAERELLMLAGNGDPDALARLLETHRQRLERIVQLRMDLRIRRRINPSDVLQETWLEAAQRLNEYLQNPNVPFFIWLRYLTHQRLAQLHRQHLGRQSRDPGREVYVDQSENPNEFTDTMAMRLADQLSSASTVLQRAELRQHLQEVLDGLDAIDRDILVLRHFEQMTNVECAQILDLSPTAASNRYIRALERLRTAISGDQRFQSN